MPGQPGMAKGQGRGVRNVGEKAEKLSSLPKNRLAAAVILALWLALAGYLVWVGLRYLF